MAKILEYMKKGVDGFFGSIIGAATGLISGMGLGFGYYIRLAYGDGTGGEYVPALAAILAAIVGPIIGGISGLLRGAYKGATEGCMAGIKFPADLYTHYFGVTSQNTKLHNYIKELPSISKIHLLNKNEISQFESHLKTIQDQETKSKLEIELNYYKKYLEQKCPLSSQTVAHHRSPLTIRVTDANGNISEKIYSWKAIFKHMDRNGNFGKITPNMDTGLAFKQEEIVSKGFPSRILEFIKTARRRLSILDMTKKLENNLTEELGSSQLCPDKNKEEPNKTIASHSPRSLRHYAKEQGYNSKLFDSPKLNKNTNTPDPISNIPVYNKIP